MNNRVTITFSRNFVAGDSIGVYYSDPSTQTSGYWTFTWVNGAAGTFQVQVGTPTTTTGEIEAIRFASSWTNSLNGFTVTQPVSGNNNQVQITSQTYHFVNVLAKFADGSTMAIPTDYSYVLSTVSTGNKITYEEKFPLNTPTADSKYLFKSDNANEIKTKHNLNDDRIGTLENDMLGKADLVGGNDFTGDQTIDGNLGIGTTTPSGSLDIEKETGVDIYINSSSGDGKFIFQDNNDNKWFVGRDNTNQNFAFSTDGLGTDDVLTLTSSGNVGVNTDAPSEKLEVDGTIKTTNLIATQLINGILKLGDTTTPILDFGSSNTTTGWGSTNLGYNNTVSGSFGFAAGSEHSVNDYAGVALGFEHTINGTYGFAAVRNNNVRVNYSAALGVALLADAYGCLVVGQSNTDITGESWYSTSLNASLMPVFVVGNGDIDSDGNSTSRSDALMVLKNGNVGIGTTPSEKLEVDGNIKSNGNVVLNENSRLKLDVDVDDNSYILHDGTNVYASANDHKFIQGSNGNYAEVHTGNLYEHFTITSLTSSSNLTDASRFLLYNLSSDGTLTIPSGLGVNSQEWKIVNASSSNTLTVTTVSGITLDFINNDGNNGVISASKSATLVRYEDGVYYLIKN